MAAYEVNLTTFSQRPRSLNFAVVSPNAVAAMSQVLAELQRKFSAAEAPADVGFELRCLPAQIPEIKP